MKRKGFALRSVSVEGPARHSVSEGGFTLIELLIVIAIIALLMAILIPALNKAKEHGKRAACLSNLKQLTMAWMMYAQANDDKLVNGAARGGDSCMACNGISDTAAAQAPPVTIPATPRQDELPWVGAAWNLADWASPIPPSENQQICAIETGALWKYLKERNVYKCPTGEKGRMVTYPMIDSMNGMYEWRSQGGGGNLALPYSIKNMNQVKRPASRLVFLDEGKLSPDSFAVYIDRECWFDVPMTRHGMGTNMSFADGHSAAGCGGPKKR